MDKNEYKRRRADIIGSIVASILGIGLLVYVILMLLSGLK